MGLLSTVARWIVIGRRTGYRSRARGWVLQRIVGAGSPAAQPATASSEPAAQPQHHDTARGEAAPASALSQSSVDGLEAVMPSAELGEGDIVEAMVRGVSVALIRIDGVAHAVSGVCPHAGGPIADGTLDGDEITCPWHGWSFRVSTGACAVDPDAPLERYPVVEVEGTIYVGVGL